MTPLTSLNLISKIDCEGSQRWWCSGAMIRNKSLKESRFGITICRKTSSGGRESPEVAR